LAPAVLAHVSQSLVLQLVHPRARQRMGRAPALAAFPAGEHEDCAQSLTQPPRPCRSLSAIVGSGVVGHMVFANLRAADLRSAAAACGALQQELQRAPHDVRWCAQSLVRWSACGGGAHVDERDPAVVIGGGTWHPGGVAVADLRLTNAWRGAWRFVLERGARRGDLLFGITRVDAGKSSLELEEALATGYGFIMGRKLAPASIFFGGYSMRCCASRGDGQGPVVDYGPVAGPQMDYQMSPLRAAGDWVEFRLDEGTLRARDSGGRGFLWAAKLTAGEVWRPTVAWSGSSAAVRIVLCPSEKAVPCQPQPPPPSSPPPPLLTLI